MGPSLHAAPGTAVSPIALRLPGAPAFPSLQPAALTIASLWWDLRPQQLQEGWKGQWLWCLQLRNMRFFLPVSTDMFQPNELVRLQHSSLPWVLLPVEALSSVRRMRFSSMGASIPLWSRSLAVQATSSWSILPCWVGASKTCREGTVPLCSQVWMRRQPPFMHWARNWRLTACSLLHPMSILALS